MAQLIVLGITFDVKIVAVYEIMKLTELRLLILGLSSMRKAARVRLYHSLLFDIYSVIYLINKKNNSDNNNNNNNNNNSNNNGNNKCDRQEQYL